MRLAQLRKHLLQGVQIVGEGAVKARLRALAWRDRDGDVFGMDIQSDEQ